MKKLISILLLLAWMTPAYAVDEWTKASPTGSNQAASIDEKIGANNNALDRLLIGYRKGCALVYNSASNLTVTTGEIAVPNSDGSVVRYRRLTSNLTVTWSDIDTGAEASATTYYVYLVADTDATAPTASISTSSSAPSGKTYYTKIGSFFNNSSSDITNVDNTRNDNGAKYRDIMSGWISFNGSGTIAINDSYNVSSIIDNGTGDYTITWSSAFQTANYAVSGATSVGNIVVLANDVGSYKTTTYVRIKIYDYNGSINDASEINLIAIGDMA